MQESHLDMEVRLYQEYTDKLQQYKDTLVNKVDSKIHEILQNLNICIKNETELRAELDLNLEKQKFQLHQFMIKQVDRYTADLVEKHGVDMSKFTNLYTAEMIVDLAMGKN